MSDRVSVRPDVLVAAAAELDAAALRFEAALGAAAPGLAVLPPGAEEVSRLVSRHFTTLARSFHPAATRNAAELRALARAVREGAHALSDSDVGGGRHVGI